MSQFGRLPDVPAALGSVRVRLTLWYVALLALILLIFSAALYASLARGLRGELDVLLEAHARQIVAAVELHDGEVEAPDAFAGLPPGTLAVLYDRGGRRIAGNATGPALPRPPPSLAGDEGPSALRPEVASYQLGDGEDWRVLTVPVAVADRVVGVLQVARSEQDVEAALRQLLLVVATAVPLTLVAAVGGGIFLAGRALEPVDRITRAAERIGAEDLSDRIGLRGHDEMSRLAAAFDRMLGRLEEAFRRQRQFTADASHELRTPLALLAAQADVALERGRSPAEYRRVLASMRDDAQRMGRLLGEMLTLARADAGQEALEREPLDLLDLVREVVETMAPLAAARSVELRTGDTERVLVRGDQTRLTQLLVNLVENAVKYTPPGGWVAVSAARHDRWALLRVADTGIGIAPEHLPHLFERFYRVDRARARADGGAGLGLAICRWIAQAHGGDVAVASELGQGSTFTVRLPAVPAPPVGPGAGRTPDRHQQAQR